jgi:hypothetical protein
MGERMVVHLHGFSGVGSFTDKYKACLLGLGKATFPLLYDTTGITLPSPLLHCKVTGLLISEWMRGEST